MTRPSRNSSRNRNLFILLLLTVLLSRTETVQAEPVIAPRPALEAPAPKSFLGVIAHSHRSKKSLPEQKTEHHGLMILRVIPDSPADKAGLKPKDVLLHYNKTPLTSTAHLGELLAKDHPGTRIALTVERDEEQQEISVKLGDCPEWVATNEKPRSLTLPKSIAGLGTQRMTIVPEKITPTGPIHPNLILPVMIPAVSQSITISRTNEDRFRVEITEIPAEGDPKTQTLEGDQDSIHEQSGKLAEHLREEIPRLLKEMPQAEDKKSSFQFRLQPRLNGEVPTLRILMTQINKQNEARTFQLTQTFPDQANLKVEDLLTVEPFAKELKQLPKPISQSIETTLRRYRLPKIELDVQNPQ